MIDAKYKRQNEDRVFNANLIRKYNAKYIKYRQNTEITVELLKKTKRWVNIRNSEHNSEEISAAKSKKCNLEMCIVHRKQTTAGENWFIDITTDYLELYCP